MRLIFISSFLSISTACPYKETKMTEIKIRDEFIKLGQAMKLAGIMQLGSDIKYEIADGKVSVNGDMDTRRGRKLYRGDIFSYDGQDYKIV